jgi:transposase
VGFGMTDILQLLDLAVRSVESDDSAYVIVAEGRLEPTRCPECRAERLYRHGSQPQRYRDTPIHGKTVSITVLRRRYRCQACGRTLFDPLASLDSKRLATTRLIEHVR